MAYCGGANDVPFYFTGDEYYNLVCDMLDLQDLISTTDNVPRSADEQEDLDAAFAHLGSRIEQDLSAARVKLDQHFRQLPRSIRWTSTLYTDINNREPLERGANGDVIYNLELIERSRQEKIRRTPDVHFAFREGYLYGVFYACTPWILASLTAPLFGGYTSYVKWTTIVIWLAYLLWPKYIDCYPTTNASRNIEMVSF